MTLVQPQLLAAHRQGRHVYFFVCVGAQVEAIGSTVFWGMARPDPSVAGVAKSPVYADLRAVPVENLASRRLYLS